MPPPAKPYAAAKPPGRYGTGPYGGGRRFWGNPPVRGLRRGLLVLTAKDRLRLLPPLILTPADVEKAAAILRKALQSI